ncbi:MAG TPA: DUF928 domain-containing protein [Abditibacteriaceae bacterium]|jgi:hypothetical protein
MNTHVKSCLVSLAALSFAAAAEAADAGVLVSVQKDVKVHLPGGKVRRAGAMQSLPAGSRVQVGTGGRAVVVLLKDGSRYVLGSGSVSSIAADDLKSVSGPTAGRLPSLKLQQAKILQGSRVAYGRSASMVVRGEDKIELQSLAGGATLQDRPVFKWSPVPGATSYKIRLEDDNDRQILVREATTSEVAYPADAPPLKSGVEYLWRVSTVVGDNLWTQHSNFHVLSDKKRQALQAELDALKETDKPEDAEEAALNSVLQAEVYAKYDLLDDAITIYEQLIAKNPDSAALHSTLATLLADQNRMESSKRSIERATKLSQEVPETE